MRGLGYVRVSKVNGREGDSFISPAEQRKAIQACAARKGVEIVGYLEELDESGGSDKRPKWKEALRQVESGEVSAVVVWNLSRFSRNLVHAKQAVERLEVAGGRLFSATEEADGFTRDILFLFAEHERERAKAGWATAVRNAVERGVYVGSAPFGYVKDESGRLLVDEQAAPLVREAFERRTAGEGWLDLARWLSTKCERSWSNTGIHKLIRNRVYLGESRNGKHVNLTAHDPIVSKALYLRAQATRQTSLRHPRTGTIVGKVASQGIAVCDSCGHTLRPNTRHRKSGQVIITMGCQHPHCSAHAYLRADLLDAEVERQLLSGWTKFRTIFKKTGPKQSERAQLQLEQAERARDDFLDNLDGLTLLGKERWNQELAKYVARVDAAQANLLSALELEDTDPGENWTRLYEAWMAADVLERRQLLQRYVERVAVLPVNGKQGVPVEQRVVVELKSGRARPVSIGLARTA